MNKDDKLFCIVCFQTLMQDDEKHPSYLREKMSMLDGVEVAYCALDRSNQHKVLDYYSRYNLTLPEVVTKYECEVSAMFADTFFKL